MIRKNKTISSVFYRNESVKSWQRIYIQQANNRRFIDIFFLSFSFIFFKVDLNSHFSLYEFRDTL